MAGQQKDLEKKRVPLKATSEEVKKSCFSPQLIQSLRRHLGISQKVLAILTGVGIGAVHLWESGKFMPKEEEEEEEEEEKEKKRRRRRRGGRRE